MAATLVNLLFGCAHRKTSFPITLRGSKSLRKSAGQFDTYVVCLDCGKEFPYSWEEMRILPTDVRQETAPVRQPAGFLSILK